MMALTGLPEITAVSKHDETGRQMRASGVQNDSISSHSLSRDWRFLGSTPTKKPPYRCLGFSENRRYRISEL